MEHDHERARTIRALNDQFRKTFDGGRVVVTAGVSALGAVRLSSLLATLRSFDKFDADNDPYGEHDFGAFDHRGERFFFKIDYFDANLEYASEDPSDAAKTIRVLTLMFAHEY